MGVDIQESYYFMGSEQGVKTFYDFLYPYSINAQPEQEKDKNSEYEDMLFELSKNLDKLINEKYPIDKTKIKETYLGWFIGLGEVKQSGGRACFHCSLDNRNSISAFIFKELLDKYFPGVYMYYQYSGDSAMFNTYFSNDKDMRFFDYAPEGTYRLAGGWNEINVLYDGNYTKDEIINSYKLFLGNPDIDPTYIPVFCGEQALHEDQYPIEDLQVENAGIAEPDVEICQSFRDKPKTSAEQHGLKPEWQNAAQRSIDYEKYPELKGTPHIIGTKEDGTPYLYRAVVYDKTVKIPACITTFDEQAFDLLYETSCDFSKEYSYKDYELVLTEEQKNAFDIHKVTWFFQTIKSESGKVFFEHKNNAGDPPAGDDNPFPDDLPF